MQCRYGVEYVRDARGEAVPVCHGVRRKPMRLDRDFQRACELAPADVRQQYEADAKYIDQAQARIMKLQRDDEGYDIFLCYKETDPVTGGRTRESMDVQQLYNILSREGYRVFYAPESLRAMVGEDYEAAIYRAIETATVMLVTATAPEHLTSTWVKSEWSRFLERVDEGEQKFLFPLYRGMRPEHLPLDFTLRHLHGLDMDQMMFLEDLKSALKRCIAKARQPREIPIRWDGEPQDPPRTQARPCR